MPPVIMQHGIRTDGGGSPERKRLRKLFGKTADIRLCAAQNFFDSTFPHLIGDAIKEASKSCRTLLRRCARLNSGAIGTDSQRLQFGVRKRRFPACTDAVSY